MFLGLVLPLTEDCFGANNQGRFDWSRVSVLRAIRTHVLGVSLLLNLEPDTALVLPRGTCLTKNEVVVDQTTTIAVHNVAIMMMNLVVSSLVIIRVTGGDMGQVRCMKKKKRA